MTRPYDTGRPPAEEVLLPREMDEETREALDAVGVKWVKKTLDPWNSEWQATLPKGWRLVSVGKDLRRKRYLVDGKGQRRVSVNFSSGNQKLIALRRFGTKSHRMFPKTGSVLFGIVVDYGAPLNVDAGGNNFGHVLHTTEAVAYPLEEAGVGPEIKANELACQWLDQNYPDWGNPAAYWD